MPAPRRRPRRPVAVLALVAGFGLLAAAVPVCGGDSDRLVVYSGRTEDLIGPLLERFNEETGVKIDVRYGDSADLALLIDTEGENSPADVFISQSPGAVGFLDANDHLAALPDDVLGLVDEENRASDGNWVGLSGRVRVLVYNEELVDPAELPESVFDVTEEPYAGRVAVAPSNGSFIDFVTAMREELGDDVAEQWLDDMAASGAPTYANNNAIVEAVGRGEVPMGLVNHYYNARAKAEDPDVVSENHYFTEPGDLGSLVIVTAASKLKTTDHDAEAEQLVEFLLSKESQQYFAEETFEYPMVEGVEPVGDIPPLADLPVTRIDLDELGGGLEATQAMIDASGIADG